jgi:hypothetical protein
MFVLVFVLEFATTIGIYRFFSRLLGWLQLMAIWLWRLGADDATSGKSSLPRFGASLPVPMPQESIV